MSRGKQGDDDGFLARWSRRKQLARDGQDAPEVQTEQPVAEPPAEVGEVDEDSLSDAELLARYELPDPETLTASDNVAAFMRKGVPSRLRRLALRRLWRLDPVLANLDGLNDYDEDYTNAVTVVEGLKTVYQVGKGAAAHLQETADKVAGTEPEPDAAATEEPGQGGDAHVNVNVAADAPEAPSRPEAQPVRDPGDGQAAAEAPQRPRRRHMAFSGPDGRSLDTASRHFNN